MTGELCAAAVTAVWTGVLTSVSPCPLATNIAALSYISGGAAGGRSAMLANGGLYALGRALAYVAIGFLLVKSLLSVPGFSFFMQKYGNQALSPLLVLAGMYMLGMFGRGFAGFDLPGVFKFGGVKGPAGALVMGFLFALVFCPISAALYFGVIIPLAAKNSAPFSIPLLYGLGTALPVVALATGIHFGLKKMSAATGWAGGFEKYAKPVTGWVFVMCGVYLGLRYIFALV